MPDTLHDFTLGLLTWDDEEELWQGHVTLTPGQTTAITLSRDEDAGDDTATLAAASQTLTHLRDRFDTLRHQAARDLLDIYNAAWQPDAPLTQETFAARFTPAEINFAYDGSAELYFDSGDLFGGHSILVHLSADGASGKAHLVG